MASCILETEKLIFDVSYEGKKYWENAKKHKFAFVDGGAYSSFLSSSAPFAIRANTYIVKPDELLERRELFRETVKFVGNLYDPEKNLYDFTSHFDCRLYFILVFHIVWNESKIYRKSK